MFSAIGRLAHSVWHATVGNLAHKVAVVLLFLAATYAGSHGGVTVQPISTNDVSQAAGIITQMQQQNMLPPSLTTEEVAQAEAQLGVASNNGNPQGNGQGQHTPPTVTVKLPPALPNPGQGDLHVVTEDLTKGIGVSVRTSPAGETFYFHDLTVNVTQDSTSFAIDTAFTVTQSLNTRGDGWNITACHGTLASGSNYWELQWPTNIPQYSGPFTYPGSPAFLDTLQQDGFIQASKVDLAGAPYASWPTNLYFRQPSFATVLAEAGEKVPQPGLAKMLVPGTLYLNLELRSKPGENRWRVSEWNYAFEPSGSLINMVLKCATPPPPTPPPSSTTTSTPVTTPPSSTTLSGTEPYPCAYGCGSQHFRQPSLCSSPYEVINNPSCPNPIYDKHCWYVQGANDGEPICNIPTLVPNPSCMGWPLPLKYPTCPGMQGMVVPGGVLKEPTPRSTTPPPPGVNPNKSTASQSKPWWHVW